MCFFDGSDMYDNVIKAIQTSIPNIENDNPIIEKISKGFKILLLMV